MKIFRLVIWICLCTSISWSFTAFAVTEVAGYRYNDGIGSMIPIANTSVAKSTYSSQQNNFYVWDMQAAAAAILDPSLVPALHVSSTYNANRIYNQSEGIAFASAVVSDTIHLVAGPPVGSFKFFISDQSTIAASSPPASTVSTSIGAYASSPIYYTSVSTPNRPATYYSYSLDQQVYSEILTTTTDSGNSSFSIPFNGSSATYSLSLRSFDTCGNFNSACSSAVDSSVSITGLQVLDAAGNLYFDAKLTSDSGFAYLSMPVTFVDPLTIPEPNSKWLFSAGLLLLLLCRSGRLSTQILNNNKRT